MHSKIDAAVRARLVALHGKEVELPHCGMQLVEQEVAWLLHLSLPGPARPASAACQ